MSTPYREQGMRDLAKGIEDRITTIYGQKMGFFLCLSPFDSKSRIADYISNSERETVIEWMKETIQRFENNESITDSLGGG